MIEWPCRLHYPRFVRLQEGVVFVCILGGLITGIPPILCILVFLCRHYWGKTAIEANVSFMCFIKECLHGMEFVYCGCDDFHRVGDHHWEDLIVYKVAVWSCKVTFINHRCPLCDLCVSKIKLESFKFMRQTTTSSFTQYGAGT